MPLFSEPATLLEGFLWSSANTPRAPALELGTATYSYAELSGIAGAIGCALGQAESANGGELVAVLASRSLTAYAGALGVFAAGRGFVALNPKHPARRSMLVLTSARVRTVVVGAEGLAALGDLLEGAPHNLTVVSPEIEDFGALARRFTQHHFIDARNLPGKVPLEQRPAARGDICYVAFTSGTTGVPKGVAVTNANMAAYMRSIMALFPLTPADRVSQTFELTFDLALHDMFTTWWSAACLCPLSENMLRAPARFIRDKGLTVWYSVPSVAMVMIRLGLLRPGSFPGLRLTKFVGEPLPARTVSLWADAAPNSAIHNLYGPTETTMVIASYDCSTPASRDRSRNGVVPIGNLFPTGHGLLLDEVGGEAARGELYLSGPQVSPGYLGDPGRTAERFLRLPGQGDKIWYRTGDIVERDVDGTLHYVGRVDDQIKFRGNRIELLEIDAALREASGVDFAVAVAWPVSAEGIGGIVGFVATDAPLDDAAVLAACAARLPSYMVPSRIYCLPELPLNVNGKIDRRALQLHLDRNSRSAMTAEGGAEPA